MRLLKLRQLHTIRCTEASKLLLLTYVNLYECKILIKHTGLLQRYSIVLHLPLSKYVKSSSLIHANVHLHLDDRAKFKIK